MAQFWLACGSPVISGIPNITYLPSRKEKLRILDGRSAEHSSSYPFVVAVMKWSSRSEMWLPSCVGIILSKFRILTACHCIARLSGDSIKYYKPDWLHIIAGSNSFRLRSSLGQKKDVHTTVAHPLCALSGKIVVNDCGMIYIKSELRFTQDVRPVKLSSYDPAGLKLMLQEYMKSGVQCQTVGWGATQYRYNNPSVHSEILRITDLKMVTSEKCHTTFCTSSNANFICHHDLERANQICAVSTSRSSPCTGDSGGPLVCNGYVFGIFSWSESCHRDYPAIFTNILLMIESVGEGGIERRSWWESNGGLADADSPLIIHILLIMVPIAL
ncbi:hypothetical protein GE061_013828 [Apolygus lucorum]|uniref:Uncharacterized protein n=1 Tax=Apolygus lucorum TaxID=248454 RepID=A0A6A4KC82_APOLU|nr:hypothetical protein GE061_013828 [Apolygus lucorum]